VTPRAAVAGSRLVIVSLSAYDKVQEVLAPGLDALARQHREIWRGAVLGACGCRKA
jgi:hypothetical protein